jgi:hypothetical protein
MKKSKKLVFNKSGKPMGKKIIHEDALGMYYVEETATKARIIFVEPINPRLIGFHNEGA